MSGFEDTIKISWQAATRKCKTILWNPSWLQGGGERSELQQPARLWVCLSMLGFEAGPNDNISLRNSAFVFANIMANSSFSKCQCYVKPRSRHAHKYSPSRLGHTIQSYRTLTLCISLGSKQSWPTHFTFQAWNTQSIGRVQLPITACHRIHG